MWYAKFVKKRKPIPQPENITLFIQDETIKKLKLTIQEKGNLIEKLYQEIKLLGTKLRIIRQCNVRRTGLLNS